MSHMSRGVSIAMTAMGRVADAPAALPRDLGLECGDERLCLLGPTRVSKKKAMWGRGDSKEMGG